MNDKITWQLYYGDTAQTETRQSESIVSAVSSAKNEIAKICWEVDNNKTKVYPNEKEWQLRLFNVDNITIPEG